jgi:MATE family multidrug resistance protein
MAYRPDDKRGAFKVAQVGTGLIFLIMLAAALLFWTIPESIIRIFNGTPALLALVVPLMSISGLAVIVDGAQFVLSNALRGFGETWWPTIIQSLAFLVIMVPTAYWGMAVLNLGVAGLLWGIVIGCTVSVLLQYARLFLIARPIP